MIPQPQGRLSDAVHVTVLLNETVDALAVRDGGRYVDGTFGAGGHSNEILDRVDCRVWAIDRDPDALDRAAPLIGRHAGRLAVIEGCFGELDRLIHQAARLAISS